MSQKQERSSRNKAGTHVESDFLIHKQIAQAQYFQQSGFIGNAEKIYKSILAIQPNQPDCLHYLGLIYSEQGKFTLALEYINKSLRVNHDNPIYHNNHGLVLGRQNKLADAEQARKKAIELKPDYTEAWYNLGVIYFQ